MNNKGLILFGVCAVSIRSYLIRRSLSSLSSTSSTSSSSTSSSSSMKIAGGGERKKSQIYTRTGDKGKSSLYNGERRLKTDITFDVLGHQDELNAIIGIAREYCMISNNGLQDMLAEIQSRLFDLGAAVATPITSSEDKRQYTEFPSYHTERLEQWIDELDSQLPPITNFVIPSGGFSCTHLNHARTVCRRAERAAVQLIQADKVDAEVGKYLNRLSDLLFVSGRIAASREKKEENLWQKATKMK